MKIGVEGTPSPSPEVERRPYSAPPRIVRSSPYSLAVLDSRLDRVERLLLQVEVALHARSERETNGNNAQLSVETHALALARDLAAEIAAQRRAASVREG